LTDSIADFKIADLRDRRGQEKLASEIQPITQQVVKLAQYLNERAADNGISPFAREQLKKSALSYRLTKIFLRVGELPKIEEAREKIGTLIPVIQACAQVAKKEL